MPISRAVSGHLPNVEQGRPSAIKVDRTSSNTRPFGCPSTAYGIAMPLHHRNIHTPIKSGMSKASDFQPGDSFPDRSTRTGGIATHSFPVARLRGAVCGVPAVQCVAPWMGLSFGGSTSEPHQLGFWGSTSPTEAFIPNNRV